MKITDLKKKINKTASRIDSDLAKERENPNRDFNRDYYDGFRAALRDVGYLLSDKTPHNDYWESENEILFITPPTSEIEDSGNLYASVNVARGVDYKTKAVEDWTSLNFTMYVKDKVKTSTVFAVEKLRQVKLPTKIVKEHGKVKYKEFIDYLLDNDLATNFEIFSSIKSWQIFMRKANTPDVQLETTADRKTSKPIVDEGDAF